MSDDLRFSKPRKIRPRILVVSNPGENSDSSSDESHLAPTSYDHDFGDRPYQPPAHASASDLPFADNHAPYYPPPLTTNNLPEPRNYPSSRSNPSNPALSSPSSTSSPAIESTPPPSTPGQSNPPDLSGEGTLRQEPVIVGYPDVEESSVQHASRPGQTTFIGRLRTQMHARRSSGNRPQTSPTTSLPESYPSQASTVSAANTSRASPSERVTLIVTTDAEHLVLVDITGARDPAFIRERIFSKLQISDDTQHQYSIYLTEIGSFAIGDALTNEQLWELYRERGDERGSIKLLVSHSHARVHEAPGFDPKEGSPTVSTIPPPVLPHVYLPLRPRPRSQSRRDSMSSAGERPEAAAGYPGVDDAGHNEREIRRMPHRSPPQAYPPPRQPLPPRPRSPGVDRPQSPGGVVSPDRSRLPSSQSPLTRQERPRNNPLPTPPTQTHSPEMTRFQETMQTPQLPYWHARSGSEGISDRERAMQAADNQQDGPWRPSQSREEKEDRHKLSRRPGGLRRHKVTYHESADAESKRRGEEWTFVQPNIPTSTYSPRRDRPTTPQDPKPSSSKQSVPYPPLNIPHPPRHPPPPPPTVENRDRDRGKRQAGKVVPDGYIITYKGPQTKTDSAPAPQSPPGPAWPTFKSAKSMTDIRTLFKTPHPATLQAGRRPPASPLPVSSKPPSASGSASSGPPYVNPHPLESSTTLHQETSSAVDSGLPKSYDGPRGPLASPTKMYQPRQPNSSTYASAQPTHNPYLGLPPASASQEASQRPSSSQGGDPSTSPYRSTRHLQSPNGSELPQESTLPRASPIMPSHYPTPSTSGMSYREDAHPPQTFGPRPLPSYPRQTERPATENQPLVDRPAQLQRAQRTPPRSPVSQKTPPLDSRDTQAPQPSSGALQVRRTLSSLPLQEDEPSSAENTVRHDEVIRYLGMFDNRIGSGSETIMPSKPQPRPALPLPQAPSPPSGPPPDLISFHDPEEGTNITMRTTNSDDSDKDGDSATYWAVRPQNRPTLPPINTDNRPSGSQSKLRDQSRVPPANLPAVPNYIPDPPPSRPLGRTQTRKAQDQRTSKFDNNFDYTWAPRPPPEEVFESLQEYFPEHDVDEPVIESGSGGTSPTSAEPDPMPQNERRFKHKKSIRVVAAEHKKRVDRTSRAEATVNPVTLRKRNTKLWGSRLEEVTMDAAHGHLERPSSADASPGPAKPIFRWVRGELIGKGTYGRVYLALNATTGEMIAVKQVEMPQTASDKDDSRQASVVEALKLESETLKDLDHPNIVQYLGFEETPTFLSIFLEYVPGGSIASCLRKYGKFDEEVTKSFTGQILNGLEYLHSKGILHRDLKADNILVETSGICKISDFGISKRTDDHNMAAFTSMQGTVFWMAPEVIDGKNGYNSKIDIWSFGCVVFEMWTGQRPWAGKEAMVVLLQLYQKKEGPPVPSEIALSPLADDFRMKCFATNPDERPSAAELRKHPYLELQPDWTFNGFR